MIAVGTPSGSDGEADLKYVEEVARAIGKAMNGYKVIVTKSTVPTGTGARVAEWIRASQPRPIEFDVVSNPEFLREGSAIEDFMRPDRIVIGASSERAGEMLAEMYKPLYLIETTIVQTDVPTAEMIKYASNAFLATKISFINEMARLCDKVGADVTIVAKSHGARQADRAEVPARGRGLWRLVLSERHAGAGGVGDRHGEEMRIVKAVIDANERQRDYVFAKLKSAIGSLEGKTIAVLGIAFKPNTDDIREAPAVAIIRRILESGGSVRAFDPVAMPAAAAILSDVYFAHDPYDAAKGADALLIMTEWNEFRELDLPRVRTLLKSAVVVDARNVYALEKMRDSGFTYLSVGRPAVGRP